MPQSLKRPLLVLTILVQPLAAASAASAISFYTIGGGLLMQIDVETGVGAVIGETGIEFPVDAAAFGPDGQLYVAGTNAGDLVGSEIYVVDPDTAETTLLGSTGLPLGMVTSSLVFDAEGRLWMSVNDSMGMLYRVDTATGAASLEHMLDREALALAERVGEIYAITPGNVLERLDVETGVLTPVLNLDLGELFTYGASFDPAGKLRVTAIGGGILSHISTHYFVVDLASGTVTNTYDDGYFFGLPEAQARSVAMRGTPGVDIPSLGTLGLGLLSAALLGFGLLHLAGHRSPAAGA